MAKKGVERLKALRAAVLIFAFVLCCCTSAKRNGSAAKEPRQGERSSRDLIVAKKSDSQSDPQEADPQKVVPQKVEPEKEIEVKISEVIRFEWCPSKKVSEAYEMSDPEDQHRIVLMPGVEKGASYPVVVGFHGQPKRGKDPRDYGFLTKVQNFVEKSCI